MGSCRHAVTGTAIWTRCCRPPLECSKANADAGTIAEAGVSHMHTCSVMCSLAVAMASESTFSKGTLSVPMLLVTVQLLLAI